MKNLPTFSGASVYALRQVSTGKSYIGSSCDAWQRSSRHKCDLKHNRHQNRGLQAAYNECGAVDFVFDLIEQLPTTFTKARRFERENDIIRLYLDKGVSLFNISDDSFRPGKNGDHRSEKVIEAGKQRRGVPITPETREKMRQAKIGKKLSPEACAAISRSLIGNRRNACHRHTPEAIQKMRDAKLRVRHDPPPPS